MKQTDTCSFTIILILRKAVKFPLLNFPNYDHAQIPFFFGLAHISASSTTLILVHCTCLFHNLRNFLRGDGYEAAMSRQPLCKDAVCPRSLYQTRLFYSIFTMSLVHFACSPKEAILCFPFQLMLPPCSLFSHPFFWVSKIPGQYTIVPLLPLLLVVSVPKHHFCFPFSTRAAILSVVWYHIISTPQTISTYFAVFFQPISTR